MSSDALEVARRSLCHPELKFVDRDAPVLDAARAFKTTLERKTLSDAKHPSRNNYQAALVSCNQTWGSGKTTFGPNLLPRLFSPSLLEQRRAIGLTDDNPITARMRGALYVYVDLAWLASPARDLPAAIASSALSWLRRDAGHSLEQAALLEALGAECAALSAVEVLARCSAALGNRVLLLHLDEAQLWPQDPDTADPPVESLWRVLLQPSLEDGHLMYVSGRCPELYTMGQLRTSLRYRGINRPLLLGALSAEGIAEVIEDLFARGEIAALAPSESASSGALAHSLSGAQSAELVRGLSRQVLAITGGVPRFVWWAARVLVSAPLSLLMDPGSLYADIRARVFKNCSPYELAPFHGQGQLGTLTRPEFLAVVYRLAAYRAPIEPPLPTTFLSQFNAAAPSSSVPTGQLLSFLSLYVAVDPDSSVRVVMPLLVTDYLARYEPYSFPIPGLAFYRALLENPAAAALIAPAAPNGDWRLLRVLRTALLDRLVALTVSARAGSVCAALPVLERSLVRRMELRGLQPRVLPPIDPTCPPLPTGWSERAPSEWLLLPALHPADYARFPFEPDTVYLQSGRPGPEPLCAPLIVCGLDFDGSRCLLHVAVSELAGGRGRLNADPATGLDQEAIIAGLRSLVPPPALLPPISTDSPAPASPPLCPPPATPVRAPMARLLQTLFIALPCEPVRWVGGLVHLQSGAALGPVSVPADCDAIVLGVERAAQLCGPHLELHGAARLRGVVDPFSVFCDRRSQPT